MASVGRKPKPTNLRIAEGNREHRPLNKNEPKPQPVMPVCPDFIDEYAREMWDTYGPMLVRLGIMTEIDGVGFIALCLEWNTYIQAKKVVKEKGAVWESKSGYRQSVPEVKIANEALNKVKALLAEFGMTPSARARLSIAKEEEDDFEDLITGETNTA